MKETSHLSSLERIGKKKKKPSLYERERSSTSRHSPIKVNIYIYIYIYMRSSKILTRRREGDQVPKDRREKRGEKGRE